MRNTRRLFLKAAIACCGVAAGLAMSRAPLAAWPKGAFTAQETDAALRELLSVSGDALIPSDRIRLEIPNIAENGAIVPLTVEADLEGVESISLLAAKNPQPLTSSYVIADGTLPYVATRIKMEETADVIAVVKARGRLYRAAKHVRVTIGGCS